MPDLTSVPPVAEIVDVTRVFGRLRAVDGLNLQLRSHEVMGLLGPNGAGKTTTLSMLTGTLAPTRGRIRLCGHDLGRDPRAAKACLGYAPEVPPLYRDLTTDEFLDTCARLHGIARGHRARLRERAKAQCGLAGVGKRLISQLSKGYQQRIGIAQAIQHEPAIVILDEPTAGLDPLQIREIRALIRALGNERGVIFSSHILSEVQAVCDRVHILRRGRTVLEDDAAGLARRMHLRRFMVAFRSVPDPAQLGARLAELPGIESVASLPDGRWRVECLDTGNAPGHDPREALVAAAVTHGWGLIELTPEHRSLEDVFVELTREDTPRVNTA